MQVKTLLATPALIFGETVDSDVSEWRPLPGAPCNESGDNSESVFPPRYVFTRYADCVDPKREHLLAEDPSTRAANFRGEVVRPFKEL